MIEEEKPDIVNIEAMIRMLFNSYNLYLMDDRNKKIKFMEVLLAAISFNALVVRDIETKIDNSEETRDLRKNMALAFARQLEVEL